MATTEPCEEFVNSDFFRMFVFKVKECPRVEPHDWTGCYFAHPTEKARRRDPTKYTYNFNACTEFRKHGSCRSGDACLFAHGVFEGWLHPARYHTQLCKFGTQCERQVCFFAHSEEQLRPAVEGSQEQAVSQRDELLAELRKTPDMAEELRKLEEQVAQQDLQANQGAEEDLRGARSEIAALLESSRVAGLYAAYRARLGMLAPAPPPPAPQAHAWATPQRRRASAPAQSYGDSLSAQLQASLLIDSRTAFQPQASGYQATDARGGFVEDRFAAYPLAREGGRYTTQDQQRTLGYTDVGSIDPLQTQFGTPATYLGYPAAPRCAPPNYLQDPVSQGRLFSYTPPGVPAATPGMQPSTESHLQPSQALTCGTGTENTDSVMSLLNSLYPCTETQDWPHRC